MTKKDPRRWQEVIIDSPFATLTKRDVYEFYATPEIQRAILDAVGKREAIVRQSFSPEKVVLRRKDEKGRFIHLTKGRFDDWNKKRLTEVHPTFGKKVDTLLVDIDPKKGTPWNRTLRITETAAKALQSYPDVKDVSLQFSGNRGFYVRGKLDKSIGVDHARRLTQKILSNLSQRPDVSFGTGGSIRLDTTPLKVRGSVRAPYSLDARTGLVSAPVALKSLRGVKKEDFDINSVLRKLRRKQAEATVGSETRDDVSASRVNWDDPLIEDSKGSNTLPTGLRYTGPAKWNSLESTQSGINRKAPAPQENSMVSVRLQGLPKGVVPGKYGAAHEFAPGIPAAKKIHPLPTIKKPQTEWILAIQEHKAKRAGKHYDLRLVQPLTDRAHSWALPKARLPKRGDKMLLAVQQPTHKRDYALHFTGTLPAGYGAGTVTMPIKERVRVLKMTPDRVKFERPNGEVFNMFRTRGDKWGIKRANVLPRIKRAEVGLPELQAGMHAIETPWYLNPNLLKLLTIAGALQFLRENLLGSGKTRD